MCFAKEVRSCVKACLKELGGLCGLVLARSQDGDREKLVGEKEKSGITEVTGRVWESCDGLVALAEGGVGAFVGKRAEMWLGLIRDAVEEIMGWDPEEDEDEDDVFGDEGLSVDGSERDGKHGEEDVADLEEQHKVKAEMKREALRVLERVPQSVHVVVKQRLQKNVPEAPLSKDVCVRIDRIITHVKGVSQMLDATAEALYSGDRALCTGRVHSVWDKTVLLVKTAEPPWGAEVPQGRTKEDKYLGRALEWIRQVEPPRKRPDESGKDPRLDSVSR